MGIKMTIETYAITASRGWRSRVFSSAQAPESNKVLHKMNANESIITGTTNWRLNINEEVWTFIRSNPAYLYAIFKLIIKKSQKICIFRIHYHTIGSIIMTLINEKKLSLAQRKKEKTNCFWTVLLDIGSLSNMKHFPSYFCIDQIQSLSIKKHQIWKKWKTFATVDQWAFHNISSYIF